MAKEEFQPTSAERRIIDKCVAEGGCEWETTTTRLAAQLDVSVGDLFAMLNHLDTVGIVEHSYDERGETLVIWGGEEVQ